MPNSGCGPIGLITAAVAHAYSARKIIGFDNNPSRVAFAQKYISPITNKPIFDRVFLSHALSTTSVSHTHSNEAPTAAGLGDGEVPIAGDEEEHEEKSEGDRKWEQAVVRAEDWIKEMGLEGEDGFDRVVEASGAEDAGLLGVALAKPGGICGLSPHSMTLELITQTSPLA
jgi:D-xylulose reductase